MDLQLAKSLIPKLINHTATAEETAAFQAFIDTASYDAASTILDDYYVQLGAFADASNIDTAAITANIEERINSYDNHLSSTELRVAARNTKRYCWAAAAIVLLVAGTYVASKFTTTNTEPLVNVNAISVQPGTNKAVLQLDNGQQVVLDVAKDSTVKNSNGVVLQIHNAALVYEQEPKAVAVSFNTLITPKGSQYQLILPDGSKVWLNAASSIRFPTAFTGATRQVTLTGEAYFEVAKNAKQPFIVQANDMTIQVLGTHFNVMAYNDEAAMATTLLEGSVKVQQQGQAAMLVPGKQALVTAKNIQLQDADVEQATAWKDGYFSFDKVTISTIMRDIARWYDVEIGFEGKLSGSRFKGGIRRSAQLSQVLKVLELSGMRFKVDGKKIIVLND
ncbi:MAG: FecR domain-containing protein [Flavobacterium sp.]|nr:FecR domain-containing protein [Flavobacterium sp.]